MPLYYWPMQKRLKMRLHLVAPASGSLRPSTSPSSPILYFPRFPPTRNRSFSQDFRGCWKPSPVAEPLETAIIASNHRFPCGFPHPSVRKSRKVQPIDREHSSLGVPSWRCSPVSEGVARRGRRPPRPTAVSRQARRTSTKSANEATWLAWSNQFSSIDRLGWLVIASTTSSAT